MYAVYLSCHLLKDISLASEFWHLGILGVFWREDQQDFLTGWGGLWAMTPRRLPRYLAGQLKERNHPNPRSHRGQDREVTYTANGHSSDHNSDVQTLSFVPGWDKHTMCFISHHTALGGRCYKPSHFTNRWVAYLLKVKRICAHLAPETVNIYYTIADI